jgi:hypothetical protein
LAASSQAGGCSMTKNFMKLAPIWSLPLCNLREA